MANEIEVTAKLKFTKGGTKVSEAVIGILADVAGENYVGHKQSFTTSATAIDLASATVGGWFYAVNRSTTGDIEIKTGTSGVKFCTLKPGEVCLFRFNAAMTAPFAEATSGTVLLEYVLIDL